MKVYLVTLCLAICISTSAKQAPVNDAASLRKAVAGAKPGDIITMADGEWKDARIVLHGRGTPGKPVVVQPQTPGGVRLTGSSTLSLSGEYLVVKDLHFTRGTAREGDVITFRTNKDLLADHCRITGIVIDNYSQPERFKNDNWVTLWGKNNRVDHCTFVDKLNLGPTLIVELNDERSQQNNHSIDSNYFKGRQRLGSNGGETIRVGVSKYSMTPSRTRIVHNYFERCNGEVEIVSVKSGENHVSFNTFFECEGGLVLRHGSNNIVEGNLFLGNNKLFTGGVRIVNPGHKVFNNVFKDLKGEEFRSALSVMNGVPNSLINRYYQVKDVDIHHNTFINCRSILFGAGRDAERTLAPENVAFRDNLIIGAKDSLYADNNKGGGILFAGNGVAQSGLRSLPKGFISLTAGIKKAKEPDLPLPVSGKGADTRKLFWVNSRTAGAAWFRSESTAAENKRKKVMVPLSSAAQLPDIVSSAFAGDTIELTGTGNYGLRKEIHVNKPLTIRSAEGGTERPLLINTSENKFPGFIVIEDGGELTLQGLSFAGSMPGYGDAAAGVVTASSMQRHYKLRVSDCEFYDFNESSFAGIKALKSTYADSILVVNSIFRNISGSGIDLAAEKDDKGTYNSEYTVIRNCVFTNILGSALNLYRGGNDESTLGPFLTIDHCTFNEVDNREQGAVLRLLGVQKARISNCIFAFSGQGGRAIHFQESRYDDLNVDFCNLYQAGRIESFYGNVSGSNIYQSFPGFIDPKNRNFNLVPGSDLQNKGSAGKAPGASLPERGRGLN
ncbi:chondroitinase-B domain-containing protein [Pararcticibacter amylolyticus]|uniref:TonB-dependent receptor n=1 Tax=Pararcticibacter amylolyticus TaxID=2173175 RepID=A0A2U2PCN0_9SPHI|nr:chondroitinase-B domain-containing protein [Pararcticibacter amylolyticus]PWG79112.1 TonB-dependent receptor [Pararcticibacter amylolyticus]